eukprot:365023-Chlamydomonas_euryale.AAC.8
MSGDSANPGMTCGRCGRCGSWHGVARMASMRRPIPACVQQLSHSSWRAAAGQWQPARSTWHIAAAARSLSGCSCRLQPLELTVRGPTSFCQGLQTCQGTNRQWQV